MFEKTDVTCQFLEMKIIYANSVAFETKHSLVLILQEFHRRKPRAGQGEKDRIAPDLPRMRQTDVRFQICSIELIEFIWLNIFAHPLTVECSIVCS